MAREITQRELRNDSGGVMRALDLGESVVVTRNGVAVGELAPVRRRRFVAAVAAFAGAPDRCWSDATRGGCGDRPGYAPACLTVGAPAATRDPKDFVRLENVLTVVPVETT